MNKLLVGIIIGLFLLSYTHVKAGDKFTVTPTGKILIDGGYLGSRNDKLTSGVAIPDLRIGAKFSYGKYKAKLDIGYAYSKISLKDVFVERQFSSSSLLRIGHFVHQFGLQSSTSSSMKITMEEPASNEAFFNSRLVGAMYVFDKNEYFATGSVFAENEIMKKSSNETGNQGYGLMSRLVYRPFRENLTLFHIGISGAFEKPRYNGNETLNHNSFILGSNFPTRIAKVKAIEATVTDAKQLYKFSPELLLGYGPVALETQYYYVNIDRKNNLKSYKASGAYAIVRGLIKGGNYKYSTSDSGITTPGGGSLECAVSYNYSDMSDNKVDLRGGRLNDVALTFNYYINKYMIWRLRYSYTHVTDRTGIDDQTLNAIQTRFQVIF